MILHTSGAQVVLLYGLGGLCRDSGDKVLQRGLNEG